MKRYKLILIGILGALLIGACSDSGTDPVAKDTGTKFLASSSQPEVGADPIPQMLDEMGLDELLAAMTYVDNELGAGLVDLLDSNAQHTVFAPTDEAFEDLYAYLSSYLGLPITGITDIDPLTVLNLLTAHVVPGRRTSNSVVPRNNIKSITPLLGEQFFVRSDGTIQDALTGTGPRPEDPAITTVDISASNGIIHLVTQAIVAPSVAEALMGDEPSDELAAIITVYCLAVATITVDALDDFDEASRDLVDCLDDLEACTRGTLGRDCLDDFGDCIGNANRNQAQACEDFLEELANASEAAMDSARAQGLEDEFLDWLNSPLSDECLQPALDMAALCAGQ
jgi:uncharacterized surface protein with fasciclin (FAS1) repeats